MWAEFESKKHMASTKLAATVKKEKEQKRLWINTKGVQKLKCRESRKCIKDSL